MQQKQTEQVGHFGMQQRRLQLQLDILQHRVFKQDDEQWYLGIGQLMHESRLHKLHLQQCGI